jgi:PAS domain S-box-containing protein
MLQSGTMESVDMEMEALDGTFLVSCTPILAADGSLDKIIHIATDITARKEMEMKLVAELAFNRSVIYDAPEGVCVCHAIPEFPYVQFTVWNDRMTGITGYTLEEINTGGYFQTLYPDQELRARAVERIQRIINGDNLAGENWQITDKRGEKRVVAIWSSLLHLEDITNHVLGFFIDVTEHKKLESALSDQKNFTDSLIRNSAGALFVLDRQHQVQVWNRACENLTGLSHTEILGSSDHWKAFYTSRQPTLADVILNGNFSELPKLYGYVSKSAHIPNGYKAEGWFDQLNGKDRYLLIEASPVYNSNGEMTHVIESINDLTESKTLEEQLLHAQKMESIGVLAGGIAHEFNNILAVILGYGQVMRKGFEPDSSGMNDLDQILTAAERAAVLTKGLLAFSRKQRVTLKNLDLGILARNTLKSFSRIMGDDIIIKESLDATPRIIYADQALMTQVVMNLMTNARDAMPNGGEFEISIKTTLLTEPYVNLFCTIPPGNYAQLTLSDSGHGIDEETLQRIFEPFFTTKDVGKGTGLGLSVVYGIVSQHNGYIIVSSAYGEGATFDIYLPLVEQQSSKHPAQDFFAGLRGGSETILLADDEPALLTLFSEILAEMGYHVITAKDGFDAVEKFSANQDKIKLSILDVQMRRKNGLQVYSEIQLIKPECRVLFITGFNVEQFQGDLALSHDTELLTKPFAPTDLAARVRKILDTV